MFLALASLDVSPVHNNVSVLQSYFDGGGYSDMKAIRLLSRIDCGMIWWATRRGVCGNSVRRLALLKHLLFQYEEFRAWS
jgi:hypothetical protein